MKINQKGEFNPTLLIFASVLVLLVAAVGLFAYKNQVAKKYSSMNQQPVKPLTIDTDGMDVPNPTANPPYQDTKAPIEPAKPTQKRAVVVYTPAGNFSDEEKSEIEKKLVNPMVDWNIEQERLAVSISVEKYAEPVAGYAYKVNYINEDGTNGGLLFGTTTPLEWWLPECLNGCNLSAEFAEKYPEIANQVK